MNKPTDRPYHLRFQSLHKELLKTTLDFFNAKPFQGDDARRLQLYKSWLRYASDCYKVTAPHLVLRDDERARQAGGIYMPYFETIVLGNLSVTTMFHEFRHHLQNQGVVPRLKPEGIEEDARGWSLSLYYAVKPRMFTKAVRENKIHFITADQLTAKEEK